MVTAAAEDYETVQLRLIDTPGLNLSDDPVGSKARERGVAGLIRLLEERFEETLKEESRIVRTRKKQEDGMIHLGEHGSPEVQARLTAVIYLIDARSIIHPRNGVDCDEDTDWSCVGLFDQDKQPPTGSVSTKTDSKAGLDIVEIATVSY